MPERNDEPIEWITEDDLAQLKGCADEKTFDHFVSTIGGRRIDELHPNLPFPNADYRFEQSKAIIELKILETEFQNTAQFRQKMILLNKRLFAKYKKTPLSLDPEVSAAYLKGFIELFRPPIARIIKKANAQIKSTKANLGLEDHHGILLLVNDGLKELPPRLMLALLARILIGSCSSIRALVYLTNHYVVIPGDHYGRIIWVPLYADADGDGLVDFVNDLGKHWFDYCENLGQIVDDRQAGPDISLAGSRAAGTRSPVA